MRERSAFAFAPSVQSQCLSSVSSAGLMTPVAALWTRTSSRPERLDLLGDAARGDVAAHEDRLRAERAQLCCGLLRCRVGAEVADRDPRCAVARQPQGDRLADPSRAACDEDGTAGRTHRSPRGRGCEAVRGGRDRLPTDPLPRLRLRVLCLRRGEPEPLEQLDLLLAVAPDRVVLGQAGDRLAHAGADLEGEMGRRGPDECVDVLDGRLGHRPRKPNE